MTYQDNESNTEIIESNGVGPISSVNDAPTGNPVIKGAWNIGSVLTSETISIKDNDGITQNTEFYDPFSYQ